MIPSATTKKRSLISRSSLSKLKKRRGIPKDLGSEAFDYSLPASATTASKSAIAGKSAKENERSTDIKNNGYEGDFNQRHQRLDGRQSAPEDDIRARSVHAGENVVKTRNNSSLAHHSNTTATANEKNHYLAFIDSMDPPSDIPDFSKALSSSTILFNSGIDPVFGKYKSSFSKFQMDLEKAFSLQFTRRESLVVGSGSSNNDLATSQRKEISILHPFLGRIGANLCPDDSISKLSLPHSMEQRDTNLDHSTITAQDGNGRKKIFIQQVIGLNRRRINTVGKIVPLSVFQFPPNNTLQHNDDNELCGCSTPERQQLQQSDEPYNQSKTRFDNSNLQSTVESVPATDNLIAELESNGTDRNDFSKKYNIPTTKAESAIVSASNTLAKTVTTASIPTTLSKDIVIGKIRIISDRGATIREAFDIDESKCILGTIDLGDVRCFVDKRILPPPPPPFPTAKATGIDGNDGSSGSEDDDEECIAVTRYKILLHHGDHSEETNSFVPLVEKDENGNCFGWISDRGRLADDPYLILNEI